MKREYILLQSLAFDFTHLEDIDNIFESTINLTRRNTIRKILIKLVDKEFVKRIHRSKYEITDLGLKHLNGIKLKYKNYSLLYDTTIKNTEKEIDLIVKGMMEEMEMNKLATEKIIKSCTIRSKFLNLDETLNDDYQNELNKYYRGNYLLKVREEKDVILNIILFKPLKDNIEETSILNDPNIVIDVLGPWIDC